MPSLHWFDAVERLTPHTVKLSTPRGFGTGFFFARLPDGIGCALATAAHVVREAHAWEEPIRIEHPGGGSRLLKATDRVIIIHPKLDSAVLVFPGVPDEFPSAPLPLGPQGKSLKVGNEVGWLGYPVIAANTLCLFSGRVSAWLRADFTYLIDGVAINGVSGGPAFHLDSAGGLVLMGIVTAYAPNRATGESLPGLCVVQDIAQLHDMTNAFKTMKDAREKETPPIDAAAQLPPSDATRA